LPEKDIEPEAYELNGFELTWDKKLLRYGKNVDGKPKKNVLEMFIKWLQDIETSVVLVDHYVKFTRRVLWQHLSQYRPLCNSFRRKVRGYADTLHIFQTIYPYQTVTRAALVKQILGKQYQFREYRAVDHAEALRKMVKIAGITKTRILAELIVSIYNYQFIFRKLSNYIIKFLT